MIGPARPRTKKNGHKMRDEPTYPLTKVMQAIGLTEDTVTTWTRRGLPGIEIEASGRGRGRERQVRLSVAIRLAILRAGSDAGIALRQLSNMAEVVKALEWDDFKYKYVRMKHYSDRNVYYLAADDKGDLLEPPAPASPLVMIEIDVGQIKDGLRSALGEPKAPPAGQTLRQTLDSIAAILNPEQPAPAAAPTAKKKRRSRAAAPPKE